MYPKGLVYIHTIAEQDMYNIKDLIFRQFSTLVEASLNLIY